MSRTWLLLPLLLLYVSNLGSAGFGLDPDEPRYASIGREMAHSGDWITPHLNGSAWFEKPPLLYWMTAAANKLGLRDEWAARLPIALISLAFLAFFYALLEREFSAQIAMMATAILGTSAGWIAYSFAGVTDMPLAVTLNAALLVALFDTRPRLGSVRMGSGKMGSLKERRPIVAGWIAGVMLGFAILAKAFLPVILFAPVWLIARGKRLEIAAGAILIAAPWHLLVWLKNGHAFWDVYFWQQQVSRASSPSFHPQPFWFYFPVLLLAMFPWTPLFGLMLRSKIYDDFRIRSLAIWLALALVFFSLVVNKLPGYLLSLLPAVAIVLAVALDRAPAKEWWISGCMLLLVLLPSIAAVIPDGLLAGFTHAHWSFSFKGWPFIAIGAGVWWMAFRRQTALAVMAGALAAAVGAGYLKAVTLPILDQRVAARSFWDTHSSEVTQACIAREVRRSAAYALNYYAGRKLPECIAGGVENRVILSQNGLEIVPKVP